ncbi:MAG: hypothetical protein A2821_02345 [Candidatus Magasanikbacteria bacterium RIFCSPHIGHO2_01_FULL_41_23]|uniref:Sialidase domain-containing protein n=1 Tax=Candidatus Magasanikbacteria bacterium RIFCSPLOWO2_01_FULL_40_15 TaxID=1798686 RepID=A0A1F6N2K1_9BACT|nr:MAG: hypothetical protein A2821_02345 [Candidatus Magasanikbacteria bacterium RIFCSPHIGHO2_01_FULL_41_23]OGH66853.1 MAG: hypothetical protein A3C66_02130 [Candidatus Magasanikbacteria bacterium RIFCSPHIGHO2_02_FULL_41_35]OGH74836.1 MAG: hypothetical protein A3F22_04055 [Candidatus Magasanikbacteria bacterium RIFCSPHIGHO2_12_FULL_41_16]OGH78111.1 MAG: hypothetical protein A2983_03480 [Candidatus Magasanikbacteria bacterium RIFCSPLOWO2_01_FULL_40_15]
MVEDMVVDSSGNIHTVVIQSVSQTANNLVYKKYNGSSWSATTVSSTVNISYYASIKLDSSGNPGIAFAEWNSGVGTRALYYKKYNGSTWGTTVEVETGMDNASGRPALEFYKEDVDANYPTIFTCHGSTYIVEEHKATGSGTEPTFAAPASVSNNNDHDCSSIDAHISATDYREIVISPKGSPGTTAYALSNDGSGWNASTLFTSVDVINGSVIFLDYDGSEYHAVIIDDASASTTDNILYSKMSGGSWSAQETVVSGARLGQNYVDIVADTDNSIPYVLYFDNANNLLKYSYKQNGSWTAGTIDSGFSLGTMQGDYNNFVAGDYYSGGSKLIVLGTQYLSGPPKSFEFNKYDLTGLPTQSQEGSGVPEFSTYMYTLILIMGFGFLYRRFGGEFSLR